MTYNANETIKNILDSEKFTFKQKILCRILFIIARLCVNDEVILKEINNLDTHIRVGF